MTDDIHQEDPAERVRNRPSIWYINQYAGGPGLVGAYRAYELCKRWNLSGCDARVVMGSYNSPPAQRTHYPTSMNIDGVPYVTIATNAYGTNGFGRILSILLFSIKLFFIGKRVPQELTRPNMIIVSTVHPFGIFAGVRLARRYGAKLVFEIRDLWPLTLTTLLGKSPRSLFVLAAGLAQRYACRHADLVSSVMPRADRYFRDIDMPIADFLWVPNGVSTLENQDRNAVPPAVALASDSIRRWRKQGMTILVHAGAIGPPNAVDLAIEALIKMREQPSVDRGSLAFLVIGDGISREFLQKLGREKLGDCIHFCGRVSKEHAQELLSNCDIAWAGVRNVPELYQYGVSLNKIPSYFDAGLPVILPIAPCGDPVSESGGGIATAMIDETDLIAALDELVSVGAAARRAMGARGQTYVRELYDYKRIAAHYLLAIDRLSADIRPKSKKIHINVKIKR